jgi:hypothetical protein
LGIIEVRPADSPNHFCFQDHELPRRHILYDIDSHPRPKAFENLSDRRTSSGFGTVVARYFIQLSRTKIKTMKKYPVIYERGEHNWGGECTRRDSKITKYSFMTYPLVEQKCGEPPHCPEHKPKSAAATD